MKAVKVQYTVSPDYVETNKANIKQVMDQLNKHPIEGMRYSVFILDDGVSFVHINMANDQSAFDQLQEIPEFIAFRLALKKSKPLSPPKSQNLQFVASNFDL